MGWQSNFRSRTWWAKMAIMVTVPVEMTHGKVFLHFLLPLLLILICPCLVDFWYLIFFFSGLTDSPFLFPPPAFPFVDVPPTSLSFSFSSSLPHHLSLCSHLEHLPPHLPGLPSEDSYLQPAEGNITAHFSSMIWWQRVYSSTNTPESCWEYLNLSNQLYKVKEK